MRPWCAALASNSHEGASAHWASRAGRGPDSGGCAGGGLCHESLGNRPVWQQPPQPQRPAQRRKLPPRQLEWQGETYTARPDLESYLLIGVDEMGEAVGTESYIGGGQGDVQMLLVLDNANQTWQAL